MFEVFARDILVGHSALELGDPPVGVACGKFIATESNRLIQRECRTNHADQSGLALSVVSLKDNLSKTVLPLKTSFTLK